MSPFEFPNGAPCNPFSYEEAFSRNIGWLTRQEQDRLRHKRVAIAGLGGVGGVHLLTLCRLGIGKFHLADFDTFDLANFNRQAGATVSTLGQNKLDVMIRQARDINPELDITGFADGVTQDNLGDFLDGVDLYVDGLDFFAFEARQQVFAACAAKGIPAVTAAPLGMGAAVLNFLPGGMSFEDYFRLNDGTEAEKPLRFPHGARARPPANGLLGRSFSSRSGQPQGPIHHHGLPALRRRRRYRGPENPAWAAARFGRPPRATTSTPTATNWR